MRLGQAVQFRIEDVLDQVHTCRPGRVVSYDGETGLATVDVIGVDADGNALPRLFKVPVQHPQWGDFCIVAPLAAGDRVLLLFAESSIEEAAETGQGVIPLDPRRHAMSDAIALPGFTVRPDPPSLASSTARLRLGTPNGFIDIEADGEFRIQRGSDELFTALHVVADALADSYPAPATTAFVDFTNGRLLDSARILFANLATALANLGADV